MSALVTDIATTEQPEYSIASATTTNIWNSPSINVSITGTTTITGFGTAPSGWYRQGRFTGALTLTHNGTSLLLPGNTNITTAANDRFGALSLGSGNWVVLWYQPAAGYQGYSAYLATLAGLGHTLLGVQIKTAGGTYTPTTGTSVALVFLQAGGGGGGGVGSTSGTGRGGAGGAGETRLAAINITGNVTVTLGAAGTGATAGNNAGGTASDSTFGSSITSKGGTGGGGSTGATNGTSGTTPSGSGGVAIPPVSTAVTSASWFQGGSSLFGLGAPNLLAGGGGPAASGYGAGGAGGYDTGTSTRVGGNGGDPMCLIIEYA